MKQSASFERDLDTRLDSKWSEVYPARGDAYFACPVCGALVPAEEAMFEQGVGGGRVIAGWVTGDAVERHKRWHRDLSG